MCNDREDEIDRLTARVRQLEMEAASRLHTTQQSDFPFEADRQHKQKCMRRQQTRQRSGQRPAPSHDSDGGGGRRRGFCRWFNVAKGWGFITPDNGDRDVFVHHSVIHKAGFRSLGKGELVEFEPRLSYKGVEATFVCGIGGVKCRGSDRRPKEKFQSKPVQLQQRQPQRRQSQAELQRDRFHGRSGRSTCNITSWPVDDSDEGTPFWYGTLPPHQARTRLIPKVTVPVVPDMTVTVIPEVTVCAVPDMTVNVVPEVTVPVVPDMTVTVIPEVTVPVVPDMTVTVIPEVTVPVVPDMTVTVIPEVTVPVVPDMTVTVIPEVTVPAVSQPHKWQRFAVRQA
ncbi:uncharacterized protein LOC112569320 [Pomacea canaliculata]|uniref:uncharacterized protein LOC112569320 n=1 Tax=Pomacea canaliculata TaxID=400727 RepID=UPI000D730CA8|nr:uncharacterized protein LOC112569320 [Pomacea canaliculata]